MNAPRLGTARFAALLLTLILAAFRPWSAEEPPLMLVVDVSDNRLAVVMDGRVVETYPVSVGTEKHPTPQGEFTVSKVIWNPGWVPPPDARWARNKTRKAPDDPDNPMKMAKIFFQEPDYYIHGTDATHRLGEAASHGCIRMRPGDVARVAMQVMEHGGEPRPRSWFEARIEGNQTHTIPLPDPVPIRVQP